MSSSSVSDAIPSKQYLEASNEVLAHIVGFLPTDALAQASLVARNWAEVSRSEQQWKEICLDKGYAKKDEAQTWTEFAMSQVEYYASFEKGEILSRKPAISSSNIKPFKYMQIGPGAFAAGFENDGLKPRLEITDLKTGEVVDVFPVDWNEPHLIGQVNFDETNLTLFHKLDGCTVFAKNGESRNFRPTQVGEKISSTNFFAIILGKNIYVHDAHTGEMLFFRRHANNVTGCAFFNSNLVSSDGLNITLGENNDSSERIATHLGKPVFELKGNRLISSTYNATSDKSTVEVHYFDQPERDFSLTFEKQVSALALQGNILALKMLSEEGTIHLVDTNKQQIGTFSNPDPISTQTMRDKIDQLVWDGYMLLAMRRDILTGETILEKWDFSKEASTENLQPSKGAALKLLLL